MIQTMLKVERNEKMAKAIARCKHAHPRARRITRNLIAVSGRNGNYTVTLVAPKADLLLAACDCPAGQSGQLCYHVAAACAVPGTIVSDVLAQETGVPAVSACSAQEKAQGNVEDIPAALPCAEEPKRLTRITHRNTSTGAVLSHLTDSPERDIATYEKLGNVIERVEIVERHGYGWRTVVPCLLCGEIKCKCARVRRLWHSTQMASPVAAGVYAPRTVYGETFGGMQI